MRQHSNKGFLILSYPNTPYTRDPYAYVPMAAHLSNQPVMPVTSLNDLFLRLADLEKERLMFTQDRRSLEEQLRQEKVKVDHAVCQAEERYVQMQQDIHHLLQMSAAANASRARYQGWPL